MRKNRNIFIKLVIVLFAIVASIFGISKFSTIAKADGVEIEVTAEKTSTNGHATPNDSNVVVIWVSVKNITSDVFVKYQTSDGSAVASAGDYNATSGTLKFTATETKKSVSIVVNKATFMLSNASDKSKTYVNTFFFNITDYSDGASINTKKIECEIGYSDKVDFNTSGTTKYLNVYDSTFSDYYRFRENDTVIIGAFSSLTNQSVQYENPYYTTYYKRFVKTGLAKFYTAFSITYWEETHGCDDAANYTLKAGDTTLQYLKLDASNMHRGDTLTTKEISTGSSCSKIKSVDNYVSYVNVYDNYYMLEIPSNITSGTRVLWQYNGASCYDRVPTVGIYDRLGDLEAPKVSKAYCDFSTSDTIKVAVRFSEPIYIKGDLPSLIVGMGGSSVSLKYDGGAYTNTLTFSAKLSEILKNNDISNVKGCTIEGINNFTSIVDFSKKCNQLSYKGSLDIENSSVNLKQPKVESSTDKSASQQKTISLTVSNVGSGKLYYAWSKDKTYNWQAVNANNYLASANYLIPGSEIKDYEDSVNFSANTDGTSYVTVSKNKIDGYYYLHVFAVSDQGRVSISVFGSNGENSDKGFLFDNTPLKALNAELHVYNKNFTFSTNFTYKDEGCAELDKVYLTVCPFGKSEMKYTLIDQSAKQTSKFNIINEKETYAEGEEVPDYGIATYTSNKHYLLAPLSSTVLKLKDNDYQNYKFRLEIYDTAGNYSENEITYYEYSLSPTGTYIYDHTNNIYMLKDSSSTETTTYARVRSQSVVDKYIKIDTRELVSLEVINPEDNIYYQFEGTDEIVFNYKTDMSITYQAKREKSNDAISFYYFEYNGTIMIQNGEYVKYEEDKQYSYEDIIKIVSYERPDATKISLEGEEDKYLCQFVLSPKVSGYLEVVFTFDKVSISDTYKYYFTNDLTETTDNLTSLNQYELLTNKVYLMGEGVKYRYLTINSGIEVLRYNDTKERVAFSSKAVALNYIRYYELQDLYLFKIDSQNIVGFLNDGGSTEFIKADDQKEAILGEYWIRYKAKTYQIESGTSSWVYYYYGTGDSYSTIDENKLTENKSLVDAINSVVAYIASLGEDNVYLAYDDFLSNNGVPKLNKSQYIVNNISVTQTLTESKFNGKITFNADTNMLKTTTRMMTSTGLQTIKFVPEWTLTKSAHSKILYCYYNGITEPKLSDYKVLNDYSAKTFQSLMPDDVSGGYYVIEVDENGAHKYLVYVDRVAPSLEVRYESTAEDEKTTTLNSNSNGSSMGVKKYTLVGIPDSEVDPYAYVSLYLKVGSGMSYRKTYRMDDLLNGEIELDASNYVIVVSDRSGNSYKVTLFLSSNELIVTGLSKEEVEKNTEYLLVSVNRDANQIQKYEVYLSDKLISSKYQATAKFYDSGYYTVKITDIYGYSKVFENVYFERKAPVVTWAYKTDDGSYVKYKDGAENQSMSVITISKGLYLLTTSTYVRLSFQEAYSLQFDTNNINTRRYSSMGNTYVEINTLDEWTLTVAYEKYPDISITYMCRVDNTSPKIDVTYTANTYKFAEQQTLDTQAINTIENGTPLIAYSAKYVVDEEITKSVQSGSSIQTPTFYVSASHEYGIYSVHIYRIDEETGKEKLIVTLTNTELLNDYKVENYPVTEYGKFIIVAKDLLGKKTSFEITNEETAKSGHTLDDNEVIDSAVKYGNTSDVIRFNQGYLTYYIEYQNKKLFMLFTIDRETGSLCRADYVSNLTLDENGKPYFDMDAKSYVTIKNQEELYILDNIVYEKNTWYAYNEVIEYMCDGEFYYIRVTPKEGKVTINASILTNGNSVYYEFNSILSTEVTDIKVKYSSGVALVTNHDGEKILVHDNFNILHADVSTDITLIRFSYSKTGEFEIFNTVYEKGKVFESLDTQRDGFYCVRILNVYGNILDYIFVKSNSMILTAKVQFEDGETINYSSEYSNTIYSNSTISFTLVGEAGSFTVLLNGEEYNVTVLEGQHEKSILLTLIGEYEVRGIDAYGNEKIRTCVISKNDFKVSDDIIYGYNEKALGKSEHYTNNKLSINFSKLSNSEISYIEIINDKNKEVVYDFISESKVHVNGKSIIECIGKNGSGDYKVIFRDKYGNIDYRMIHYKDTPTLSVTKNIRSDVNYKEVSIDSILEQGVWSNNAIKLSSSSVNYIIKVDGVETRCTKLFEFSTENNSGSFVYDIYYLDEYGFELSFKVYLIRQVIDIVLDNNIKTTLVGDVLTTQDNVTILFNDTYECYYTKNTESKKYSYKSGTQILEDGLYRFTITDYAGNAASYVIKKDTSCEYKFVEQQAAKNVISGGVATTNKVIFKATNEDTSYIKQAFLNGEEIKIKDDEFTANGRYDVLISDAVGNTSVFKFYIITHELASFNYEVPYNYEISEIWITKTTGERYSLMDLIDKTKGFEVSTDSVINEDGEYSVVIQSTLETVSLNFSFVIKNTPPTIKLEGVKAGEVTMNEVKLLGYTVGDTIYIYRDGSLAETIHVDSTTKDVTVKDGGEYRIVYKNAAGVTSEVNFSKKKITNVAGSVLIMLSLGLFSLVLFIGIMLRRRSRIDK